MQAEFKALAIGDDAKASKKFKQGADVLMSLFKAILIN